MKLLSLLTACIICSVPNCTNNPGAPGPPAKPDYTEPEGTVHDGDYFPLAAGRQSVMLAQYSTVNKTRTRGTYEGVAVDTVQHDTSIVSYRNEISTLGQVAIMLSTGQESLYAVRNILTQVDPSSAPRPDTSYSFYNSTADAIYIRAIVMSIGGVVDTTEYGAGRVFLKKPLVVADSWSAVYPSTSQTFGVPSFDSTTVTGTNTVHVIGNDTVILDGDIAVEAVRLHYVYSATTVGHLAETRREGESNGTASVYLVKDTGTVKQSLLSTAVVTVEANDPGIEMTITINTTMESHALLQTHSRVSMEKNRTAQEKSGTSFNRLRSGSPSAAIHNLVRASRLVYLMMLP